nr:hypothetical protein CFP56_41344 [Quercus suber]
MPVSPDPSRDQPVIRGPFSLFDDSFFVEFLEVPKSLDATCLLRVTIKARHPLVSETNTKRHPQTPPLHIHFAQTETFQILQGKFGVEMGWDRRDYVLTPESGRVDIPPWVPHMPYPLPGDEDTVVLLWAHPQVKDDALDAVYFERIFLSIDRLAKAISKADDSRRHETASTGVMLPSWRNLGPLRWVVPWVVQAGLAGLARILGYESLPSHSAKNE